MSFVAAPLRLLISITTTRPKVVNFIAPLLPWWCPALFRLSGEAFWVCAARSVVVFGGIEFSEASPAATQIYRLHAGFLCRCAVCFFGSLEIHRQWGRILQEAQMRDVAA
jgi:hypothetical protein